MGIMDLPNPLVRALFGPNIIWWAQPEGRNRRPVLLISREISYQAREAVTIAEITTGERGIPVEVQLDKEDGLPRACAVNLDNIITVKKSMLTSPVATLSPAKMARVNRAIVYALGLDEPI